MLREKYIDNGIPFLLRRKDASKISSATPPENLNEVQPVGSNMIHVVPDKMSAKFDGLDVRWLMRHHEHRDGAHL